MSLFRDPLPRGPVSRRDFLRGSGVALALPLLDSMRPAICRAADDPKAAHGLVAIQTNMGILPQHFFPSQKGKLYSGTPYLEILKGYRDRMTVFSGVSHPGVDGGHQAESSFLSAAPHPGSVGSKNTISLDQYAVEHLGRTSRFPSFNLSVNDEGPQGMVFTRSGVKIPTEKSPAALYRKMFVQGDPAEIAARVADLREGRSLLDFVSADAKRLNRRVGPADRARLDQYYSSVRQLEVELAQAQAWERRPKPKPPANAHAPVDIEDPKKLIDRIRLMLEVATLALQTDSTRIVTLFINAFSYVPDIPGVKDETHTLTHHGNRPEALDQLFKIESAQFRVLAGFLGGLDAIKQGGRTLLDRTMVLYGAPMGSANSHANTNLPILLAGGGFKHAGHLAFDTKKNYPLPNLFVSMLQGLGIEAGGFASSTGTMTGLDLA
jgi:hypothetical protein